MTDIFKCAAKSCPGYSYKASEMKHPCSDDDRPHSVVVKLNDAELAWLEACAGYLSRRGRPTSLEGMLRIAVAEWSPPIDVSLSACK
jgi:hypothetical protein